MAIRCAGCVVRVRILQREKEREGKLAIVIVIVIVVCLIYASLLLRALHVLRQHVRTVFPPPPLPSLV